MKWPKAFLVVSTLLLGFSKAQASEPEGFASRHWVGGLHLLAGFGVNTSYFESDLGNRNVGLGLNIQTSLGYFFMDRFAIEFSTNVMFNRVKRIFIWDTLQTVGLRIRVPSLLKLENVDPYLRLMAGSGPSVLIYKGPKPPELEIDGDRTQIEGDIIGFAYGIFQNARDGNTWYLELGGTVQYYRRIEAIVDKNDVPEVIDSRKVNNNSTFYAISLTIGMVMF